MRGERYERPRVDDRTPVSEPLNVVSTSGGVRTPVWRPHDGDEPTALAYESPEVVERTSVSEPLNAATSSQPLTPAWRPTRHDS
ncbi:MAG TPA: hypothetical protein VG869_05175 [Acidimicrobiia bacterium]|jgi:hypothetical protein|nr:hypothetical protein [Acidimicrobiia bacterium]